MNENNIEWDDIDKARNILLTRSDWTQLLDAGLSTECVLEWRKWREEVRKVNRTNYSDRISAKMQIRKLNDNQPTKVKGDLDLASFLSNTSRDFIKKVVEEVLDEHGYEILDKEKVIDQVESKVEEFDEEETIFEVRERITKELYEVFVDKIKSISPDPALSILYIEMLNESIDCLSNLGSYFPMIESEDVSTKEHASRNVEQHGKMIIRYKMINNSYLKWESKIKDETLSKEELEKIPDILREEIDGY